MTNGSLDLPPTIGWRVPSMASGSVAGLPPDRGQLGRLGFHLRWKEIYGYEYLYSGPLFTDQLSHLWIDFRGIQAAFMRAHGIDYFENSRRATFVHQQYAIRNPLQFECYNELSWGSRRATVRAGPCAP